VRMMRRVDSEPDYCCGWKAFDHFVERMIWTDTGRDQAVILGEPDYRVSRWHSFHLLSFYAIFTPFIHSLSLPSVLSSTSSHICPVIL